MFLFRNVMFSFINEMFECLINEFVEGRIYKYVKSGEGDVDDMRHAR